jgi:hypothetical protein
MLGPGAPRQVPWSTGVTYAATVLRYCAEILSSGPHRSRENIVNISSESLSYSDICAFAALKRLRPRGDRTNERVISRLPYRAHGAAAC